MGQQYHRLGGMANPQQRPVLGIVLQHDGHSPLYRQRALAAEISHWLQLHNIPADWIDAQPCAQGWRFRLTAQAWSQLTPDWNTLDLHTHLPGEATLAAEILLALLASPVDRTFPNLEELNAHLESRLHTCHAAAKTTLAFATQSADRPASHWRYSEATGFILQPGVALIEALTLATQPAVSGTVYDFSCYRATEYVLLLGLAHTLQNFNPDLLSRLESQWRREAIASGRFHDTFLDEIGSLDEPLPGLHYVPGDRVWFRNPDERSADVVGFEGSWVVYMGRGRFTDFWRPQSSYSLRDKCLEIHFWRDAVVEQPGEENTIDETRVWEKMRALQDGLDAGAGWAHEQEATILRRMMRYRDARGVYADGGCIDATREHLRWMCPGFERIDLPSAQPLFADNEPGLMTGASGLPI
jgi:hypothetical protein